MVPSECSLTVQERADSKHSHYALLIYPIVVKFEASIRDVRVCSLTFALDDDLEQAGQAFLENLLRLVG